MKKWLVSLLLLGLALSLAACGGSSREVYQSFRYASVRFTLPESWESATNSYIKDEDAAAFFCVRFWRSDRPDTVFFLWCMKSPGIADSQGAVMEEIRLESGMLLTQYTEQMDDLLSLYIVFPYEVPGNYLLSANVPAALWEEYRPQLLETLETLRLGERGLSYDRAMALAEDACTIDHDRSHASFDSVDGVWTIAFYTAKMDAPRQTVSISSRGKILDITQ